MEAFYCVGYIFSEYTYSMWMSNVKMVLRELGWGGMDWFDLAQNRDQCRTLVNTVMNLWIP
jgi:hypothetical protein